MREKLLLPILLIVCAAGCGGSTATDGGVDQAAPPDLAMPDLAMVDLAPPPPDLGPLGCAAMVACTRMCAGPNSGNCVSACIQQGSQAAMTYFQPLAQCAGPACSQQQPDAGVPPCGADPSSQACIDCVMQHCAQQLADCEMH